MEHPVQIHALLSISKVIQSFSQCSNHSIYSDFLIYFDIQTPKYWTTLHCDLRISCHAIIKRPQNFLILRQHWQIERNWQICFSSHGGLEAQLAAEKMSKATRISTFQMHTHMFQMFLFAKILSQVPRTKSIPLQIATMMSKMKHEFK